jgi:glycosidase
MWGANDPDCRKPMLWADKKYDAETYNPDQTKHGEDEVASNSELFNWYKKFIALRNKYKSIRLGTYSSLLTDNAQKIYAFSRKYANEEVIVIVNRGNQSVSLNPAFLQKGTYKDVNTKKTVRQVNIKPMDILVLSN